MITLSVDDQRENTSLMKTMLAKIDPTGTHLSATSAAEAVKLIKDGVQVVFLDIEMPGINGIDAADLLREGNEKLNIIFVTGHPEYALTAHSVFPSGFITKPVDEKDIRRALKNLRYPVAPSPALRVRCSPFTVYSDAGAVAFKGGKTGELFAYLIYRRGAFCTNDEMMTALWGDNPDKGGRLRQVLMDLRSNLTEAGAVHVVIKKYGKLAIKTELIETEGDIEALKSEFGWIIV